jgi:hypothetical protein
MANYQTEDHSHQAVYGSNKGNTSTIRCINGLGEWSRCTAETDKIRTTYPISSKTRRKIPTAAPKSGLYLGQNVITTTNQVSAKESL